VKSLVHNSIPFLRLLTPEEVSIIIQGASLPSDPGSFHIFIVELVIFGVSHSMEHFGSILSWQVHGSVISYPVHCARVFLVKHFDFVLGMFQVQSRFPSVVFCCITLPLYSVLSQTAMASRVQYFFYLALLLSLDFYWGWVLGS
jgi:hypothetical protein